MGIGAEIFSKRNGEEVIHRLSTLYGFSDSGCLVGLTDDLNDLGQRFQKGPEFELS